MKNEHQAEAETEADSSITAHETTSASLAQNTMLSAALSIEGNKLIAEFDGVIIGVSNYSWRPGCIEPIQESHLAYHREWGWLMPVVEKIERLIPDGFTQIYGEEGDKIKNAPDWKLYSLEIETNNDSGKRFHTKSTSSKIEAVWFGVVEFIKWYNDNAAAVGSR